MRGSQSSLNKFSSNQDITHVFVVANGQSLQVQILYVHQLFRILETRKYCDSSWTFPAFCSDYEHVGFLLFCCFFKGSCSQFTVVLVV